ADLVRCRLPGPSCPSRVRGAVVPDAGGCAARRQAWLRLTLEARLRHLARGLTSVRGRMKEQDLIYDWNRVADAPVVPAGHTVELDDETLRDGLQSPSVQDPPIEQKIELLHIMAALGIHTADIGLPGAGPRAVADVRALALEIARERLPIGANCAARTVVADVEPIARISQEAGIPIEACTFIGSSPIRQYAED